MDYYFNENNWILIKTIDYGKYSEYLDYYFQIDFTWLYYWLYLGEYFQNY